MSVALVDHTGPWTADDVEALPDAGDHARFEVYEGGVLVVSPAPGVAHSGRPTGYTVLWPRRPSLRDEDDLGAFAARAEHPVAVLLTQIGGVRRGGLEDAQAEQPEHRNQREVAGVR